MTTPSRQSRDTAIVLPHDEKDGYDKTYKPRQSLFGKLRLRAAMPVAAAVCGLLLLYILLSSNISLLRSSTVPSIDNVPHMLLIADRLIEYHYNVNNRFVDLANTLKKQGYRVSVMTVPDGITSQLDNTFYDTGINTMPYSTIDDLLKLRRADESAEITAVFTYLWFWSTLTVPERVTPLVRALSPHTLTIVLTDDVHHLKLTHTNEAIQNDKPELVPMYTAAGIYGEAYEASIRKRERSIYTNADQVITATTYDQQQITQLLEGQKVPVTVARWAHNITHMPIPTIDQVPKFWHRTGVCFIGNGHSPINQAVMKWFFEQVYPLLYRTQQGPNPYLHSAPYYIIGQTPADKYEPLYRVLTSEERASQRIRVLDLLDDKAVVHELQQCRLMIAPATTHTGVNTKVITAMAVGTPIITTQVGARGIDLDPELKLYSFGTTERDAPEAFAALLTRFYSEPAFHEAVTKKGLEAAHVLMTPTRFNEDIKNIVQSLIPQQPFKWLTPDRKAP